MIGTTTNTAEYVGNASTVTAYTIPFRFDDPSWIKITATTVAGVVTNLALTTDFLLAGDGIAATGTFTTVAAIPATTTLKVYREAPGLQTLNLETGEPLPSASVEALLDRLAMAIMDRTSLRLVNSRLPLVLAAAPTTETPSHIGQLAIVGDDSVFIATSLSPVAWLQISN